ncbi:MAG TPA: hypothetical protein VEA80_10835 [Vitreimonas sp.]|uniref:hypothetical protein n=1 Tax=Vitreimonas sp. TaxID=3069702 RepID=UPI002D3EBCB3|nr:hypothetical protein [Vitreimonas sp.]HYD87962.1 hypothetical protein [Vitreimonas sp.]
MKVDPTIIDCACGARYERREVQLPIKDIGCFDCGDCGARLEVWSGRTVPAFKRVQVDQRAAKQA